MFRNLQNAIISGGTFNSTQVLGPNVHEGRAGLADLKDKVAPGAFHNSAERYEPPKCHPLTREAVLSKIMEWVKDAAKVCLFMWLYGPAGAGKSAIAQTIAEMCYREGLLAASFFFSRSAQGRNNEVFLITTIAYQFTLSIPEIRESVGKVLEADPLILSRSIDAQLEDLIVKPLNEAASQDSRSLSSRPRFIIIDGLDECGDSKIQRLILTVFQSAVKQLTIPFSILIASRPDPLIRDSFNEDVLNSLTTRIVLDDTYKPDEDIRLFVKSRFNDIKRKHPLLANRHPPWPSDLDVELLVQKSSGQFIYATTVMKYLDSFHHWPPDRLDIIFGLSTAGDDTPLAELDLFYTHILSSVNHIGRVVEIFTVLLLVQFWTKTKNIVEEFLFYRPGEVDIALCDLHSLISVPAPGDEQSELRIFHASFPDFLLDRSRSGEFFIDTHQASVKITKICMRHLAQLEMGMCEDLINVHHLRGLFMLHCITGHPTPELLKELYDFDLSAHLNFWASEENLIGIYEHDNKRILNLLMWMENQRHPDYDQSLLQYHLSAIDDWLDQQLRSYPHQYAFKLILTAGIFTDFGVEEIFKIVGPSSLTQSANYAKPRRHDPLQLYSPKTEYTPFYTFLSRFLADQTRSNNYFVDDSQYATLAIFVAIYLADKQNFAIEKFPLDLLAFLLPISAQTPELVKVLQQHPLLSSSALDDGPSPASRAAEAISHYLREFATIRSMRSFNEERRGLNLYVAFEKLREEQRMPSDSYIAWMPKVYDIGDHKKFGYDVVFT